MKDRVSTIPNRYQMTDEGGSSQFITLVRADEPTEEGTPLNRANLLSSSTQELLGLDDEASVSDALAILASRTADTGWLSLWVNNDPTTDSRVEVAAYSEDQNSYPSYRKVGNTVYIHGVVKPTKTVSAGVNSKVIIGYLPMGFYSLTMQYSFVIQASGANRCLLVVDTDGSIRATRYGSGTSYTEFSPSTWLPFDVSFLI